MNQLSTKYKGVVLLKKELSEITKFLKLLEEQVQIDSWKLDAFNDFLDSIQIASSQFQKTKREKKRKAPNEERRFFLNQLEKEVEIHMRKNTQGNKLLSIVRDEYEPRITYGLYANTNSLKSKLVKSVCAEEDIHNELIARAVIIEKIFGKQLLPKDKNFPKPTHFHKDMIVTIRGNDYEYSVETLEALMDIRLHKTPIKNFPEITIIDDSEVDYNET